MFFPSGYYRAKARAALKGHWEIALLIALIVLLLNRNRLFRDMFVKMFIDVFYDTDRDE